MTTNHQPRVLKMYQPCVIEPIPAAYRATALATAALALSCLGGRTAQLADRTGVPVAARRALLAAAVALHVSEARTAWRRAEDQTAPIRRYAVARTLVFGGPSLTRVTPATDPVFETA